MKFNKLKEIEAENFIVFASLPDMGKVGGLVSSYLAQNLRTQYVAEIISNEKPWVSYQDGVAECVIDTYQIYYNEDNMLFILTGNSQPQEIGELYALCNTMLEYIQSIGKVRRLYTSGGYLREQLTGAPRVCGVVSKPELRKLLSEYKVDLIGNEINSITWFNGLLLGLAGERDINAVGLFGEISESAFPQPLAAKSIVRAFARIENIPLDTKPLDKQYEVILEDLEKLKGTQNFHPGIG